MPKVIFLVGLPGTGKSTWLARNITDGSIVASSDDYIEGVARRMGKTYSEVFKEVIGDATNYFFNQIKIGVEDDRDIYIDRTNLTIAGRAKINQLIPGHYTRGAVVFGRPDSEVHRRILDSRPGKHIPAGVIDGMAKSYERPGYDEGFDTISYVEPLK